MAERERKVSCCGRDGNDDDDDNDEVDSDAGSVERERAGHGAWGRDGARTGANAV